VLPSPIELMSMAATFQGMVDMFKDSFGVSATIAKKRTASYTPSSGAYTTETPTTQTTWGVWAYADDAPIGEGDELAPTRSKHRDFVVPAKDLAFEPKQGDTLTVLSETFEITRVARVVSGDTVITYRFVLEKL